MAEKELKKVLVVEDDVQFRDVVSQMLKRAGFQVTATGNGREAVEIFRENAVDLVLTDLVMPEYDGLETIIDLFEEHPETKVIAMSGGPRGNENWLPCAEKLGAQETLKKPFGYQDLIDSVNRVLGLK